MSPRLRRLADTARRHLAPAASPTAPALLRLAVGGYHLWHVGSRRSL